MAKEISGKLELSGVLGGVNPIYKCFTWSKQQKNAYFYACGNSIVVSDVDQVRNYLTLSGHSDRVNFVKTIEGFPGKQILVSGGTDSQLILWEGNLSENIFSSESWKEKCRLNLSHSVSFASALEFAENESYVVVGNIMGDVYLIKVTEDNCVILDSITFGHHFTQECVTIFNLNPPSNSADAPRQFIIALGGLDFAVHLYFTDISKYDSTNMPRGTLFDYKVSLKGHENAITDLQVKSISKQEGRSEWLIASASKDTYIRLWRIAELFDEEGVKQISDFQNKQTQRVTLGEKKSFVTLESVLNSHDESVVCLDWGMHQGKLSLLSASFDFNIIIWTQDEETGIWMSSHRLGQVAGSKYAFFQASFNPTSDKILSYTYTGSFYLWSWNKDKDIWVSQPVVSGHFKHVYDIDWSSQGDFLVSCGLDQTTRVFAQSAKSSQWNEVSRAQIHGYDINSVKCCPVHIKNKNVCDILICGADEKVVRLFEPPAAFVNSVNQISGSSLRLFFEDDAEEKKYLDSKQLENGIFEYKVSSEGGAQVLGLMTKAVKLDPEFDPSKYIDPEDEGGLIADKIQLQEDKKKEEELFSQKHDFSIAPTEDYLVRRTLWPELNKLYGHGSELKCVGCSSDGTLIASSAKSQTRENARVIFWNPTNYQIYAQLECHNFTINQFEFSPTNQYFASVSKDRSIAVFKRNQTPEGQLNTSNPYSEFYNDKSHTRIVYTLSFSHDEKYIATGARDKRIKIHQLGGENGGKVVLSKVLSNTITAIAFAPCAFSTSAETGQTIYQIIVGFEDGLIEIYQFDSISNQITFVTKPHKFHGHTDSISKIKFRPQNRLTNPSVLQFATCSLDHTVRVFNLY